MFKMTIVYAGKVVAYPDRSVPSSAGGRFNMAPKCLEMFVDGRRTVRLSYMGKDDRSMHLILNTLKMLRTLLHLITTLLAL